MEFFFQNQPINKNNLKQIKKLLLKKVCGKKWNQMVREW
jgi:hypothetical protein